MVKYADGLDLVATALAHAGRRCIVDRLRAGGASTTELAELLDIGLPAVTKHLALLTAAGVTTATKDGRTVTHRLEAARLDDYSAWLTTRRSFWHGQVDALTAYLEES